jgi:Type I phosphodiesterase / nucleotide pyrophosphatase
MDPMDSKEYMKLFICYLPGLDYRRVTTQRTPYISNLVTSYPFVKISTLPSTELLPTLITGVYPHEHGIWQVRLKPEARSLRKKRFIDRIPDIFSTTIQCFYKLFEKTYDLAAIPSYRRRYFDLYRFKYGRRVDSKDYLKKLGSYESIFGILGDDAKYLFTNNFDMLDSLLRNLPFDERKLIFLEMYALDLLQHWNLDRQKTMDPAYGATDDFVRRLNEKCQQRGVTLMLLVDHGQEPVTGIIPLKKELERSGIREEEFSYFLEVVQARFWFHTDRARNRIKDLLGTIAHTTVFTYKDLHQFHVRFDDDAYGELYLMADPGYIFFPHDFYHPLANLYLGLTDWHQKNRIFRPVHRGTHGYLPNHPSEEGFAILIDRNYNATRPSIELIDIAPTVLALLGRPRPEHMKGTVAFHYRDIVKKDNLGG